MARGINKVILIGNAGSDAEVRFMPSGAAVTNVKIATNENWRDRQTSQMQERTEWHRVTFMDRGNYRLGQIAGDFIKKGSKVYVEGSLRTREWEKDGIKRYTTEIVANEMQLLDSRGDNFSQQSGSHDSIQGDSGYGNASKQSDCQTASTSQASPQSFVRWGNTPAMAQVTSQQCAPAVSEPKPQQVPNFDDFDDDIPF